LRTGKGQSELFDGGVELQFDQASGFCLPCQPSWKQTVCDSAMATMQLHVRHSVPYQEGKAPKQRKKSIGRVCERVVSKCGLAYLPWRLRLQHTGKLSAEGGAATAAEHIQLNASLFSGGL
jgi:hypothetical protein